MGLKYAVLDNQTHDILGFIYCSDSILGFEYACEEGSNGRAYISPSKSEKQLYNVPEYETKRIHHVPTLMLVNKQVPS